VIRRDLDANPTPHLDSKRLPTVRPANAPEGAVGIADEASGRQPKTGTRIPEDQPWW
jgi:hypothetical protein